MRNSGLILSLVLVFLFTLSWINNTSITKVQAAPALPQDFEDVVVTAIGAPTALAFTPDGRLLITTQSGQLRIYQNGSLLSSPALNLTSRLCTNSERGLLGVAVDPEFATNNFIYLFYTFNKFNTCPTGQSTNSNNPVNRVARFTLGANNLVDLGTEVVLIDNIHSPNGNHNGGDLHFGKDGLLYISVGDGGADYAGNSGGAGANDAARDRHVLIGKILRITRDGLIPATNPFQGANSGRCNVTGSTTAGNWCQEIYATGLRNPFRIAFDPNAASTRFFINDVGQNTWEEIDEGAAGADYGWNVREGHCANGSTTNCGAPPAGMTNPIFDYPHTGNCGASGVAGNSITGGAFVPNGIWPTEYNGAYLFGEYVCGKIFKLTPNGSGGYTASEFVTGLGSSSAVAMTFGPHDTTQALYYTSYAGGGQVRRIRYTGASNRAPIAVATANPTSGPAPLNVAFDASGSSDPDSDPLTFSWNFGDNTTGTGATPTHTYSQTGAYNAVVTVSDGRGGSSTATVRIDVGNTPPMPTITSPTTAQLFRVSETITLTGSATDAQEGTLPANRLSWQVLLHHNNNHTHPYFGPQTGNNLTFTAPAPEDLDAATGSFLEIRLTATDSQGLSSTVVQNFQPRKVNITFATNPPGLGLTVNAVQLTGPQTVVSWDGYQLNVNAPNQTDASGQQQNFTSWSDGGAQSHTITTPATAATYTANFTASSGGSGAGIGLTGFYYDNANFTTLRTVRNDATVNFDWGTTTPAGTALTSPDTFSVRWSGKVQAPATGTYTFTTTSDDGVRLSVNNQLIIDNFTDHPATDNSGTINLTAGQFYDIQLEYYENGGQAVAKLSWSYPGQAQQIIPAGRLFPYALFVVGNTTLNSGDAAVKTQLESLGFAVTIKSASASTTADANNKGLIVLSSTGNSSDVNTKFRTTLVPVLAWESAVFDDLGMIGTASSQRGTTGSQTQVKIINAGHPMAAGLSGNVTVTNSASTFSWGRPNTNAARIATLTGDTSKFVIFGYEKGAVMPGLTAPARRVGLFMENTTAANWNNQGRTLFNAAVKWACGK
jgi:glucose/arabinose dehydrogenase